MSSELYDAVSRGDLAAVRALISQGADVNEQHYHGYTALMVAALEGYSEIVQLLIQEGADVTLKDDSGNTALVNPCLRGHTAVVHLLLKAGADVKSKDGIRAFFFAASTGHTELIKLFLDEGLDINVRNEAGVTALIEACTSEGHYRTVQFFLENGADPTAKTNPLGHTALHAAALNNKHEMISFLRNAGADLNARDASGATPLLCAAHRGHTETIDWLLSFGADINIPANNGTTPIMAAASNFHFGAVEKLVSGGADVETVAADGYSAVGAVQDAYERMIELLKPADQIRTLYRFLPFARLEDLIIRRTTCLTQIVSWEDSYEGFHVREIIRNALKENFPNIEERMLAALVQYTHQSMYAQCWTTLPESDALWRIYSPNKDGVRISVKREQLINFFRRQMPALVEGRVSYCAPKEIVGRIIHSLREELRTGVPLRVALDRAYFYKRLEFNHEQEFRLGALIYPPGPTVNIPHDNSDPRTVDSAIAVLTGRSHQPRYCLDFDPSLIQDVVIDPRAQDVFLARVQSLCVSAVATRHIVVRKSDLYEQPD
jgi:ankyrin repeat protein